MARKKDIEEKEVVADEADEGELRVYELAFHLEPELSENDAKNTYAAIHDVVSAQGPIVAEGTPEKVQLAYTISRSETAGRRDFDAAYFCWVAYETAGPGHDAVLAAVKAEKRVIRFLDIRTTKDAAKHSAEMREIRERAPERVEGEEPVSDAELTAAIESAA